MTWGSQTVRWRRQPAPAEIHTPMAYPKPDYPDWLECRLYFVYVWDPRDDFTSVTLGYIGETSRHNPLIRFIEHLEKPWSDTIIEQDPRRAIAAGAFVVGQEVYACKEDAWAAEEAAIREHRPLYNYEYNQDNPDRVPIPEQARQRAERDRLNGVPHELTWAVQDERREQARDTGVVPATAGRRWWTLPQVSAANQRRLAWLAGWAVITAVLWFLAVRYGRFTPTVSTPRLGGVAGLLTAWLLVWWTRPRRGRWRRLGNRCLRLLLVFGIVWLMSPAIGVFLHVHR